MTILEPLLERFHCEPRRAGEGGAWLHSYPQRARFTGNGRPVAWIAADVVRIEDGRLAEHWDVLQDEATEAESKSGRPMFGDRFPVQNDIAKGIHHA